MSRFRVDGSELLAIREYYGFTQADLAKIIGMTPTNYQYLEKGIRKSVNSKRIETLKNILAAFKSDKEKHPENAKGLPKRCGYKIGDGTAAAIVPSERKGKAHLCINGKLICGEQDIEHVRYYRSHEYFLNQCEICEDCKNKFIDVFGPIE